MQMQPSTRLNGLRPVGGGGPHPSLTETVPLVNNAYASDILAIKALERSIGGKRSFDQFLDRFWPLKLQVGSSKQPEQHSNVDLFCFLASMIAKS